MGVFDDACSFAVCLRFIHKFFFVLSISYLSAFSPLISYRNLMNLAWSMKGNAFMDMPAEGACCYVS